MKLSILLFIISYSCFTLNKINNYHQAIDFLKVENILQGNMDSLLLMKLKEKNIQTFINKRVSDFVEDSLLGSYKGLVFIDNKPGRLTSISFTYSRQVTIELYLPNEFDYSEPFNINRKWDFNLLKKEKIRDLKLKYNGREVKKIIKKRIKNSIH